MAGRRMLAPADWRLAFSAGPSLLDGGFDPRRGFDSHGRLTNGKKLHERTCVDCIKVRVTVRTPVHCDSVDRPARPAAAAHLPHLPCSLRQRR
jgi:hypothetical protein